jgi:hypothetical protein
MKDGDDGDGEERKFLPKINTEDSNLKTEFLSYG